MRTLLLLALLPLALSGCATHAAQPASGTASTATSSTAPPAPGGPTSPSPSLPPQVLYANGTVQAGLNAPPMSITPTMRGLGFPVGNESLVLVELAWDGPQDLDLCVHRPSTPPLASFGGCEDPAFSPTTNEQTLQVAYPNPEAGAWSVHPTSGTVAAQVPYRMAVSLFHGPTEAPAGYTALR